MNKELKNKIYGEYLKYWDEKMAKFCTKEICEALEVNGMIVVAEKPELQTSFYFGYSDMGQGLSYEENNVRTEQVKKHKDEYFTEKNTEGLTKIIDNLLTMPFVYVYPAVYGDTPINLFQLKFGKYDLIQDGERPYRNMNIEYRVLTMEERKAIVKMYERMLEKQTKRVQNYLKRFSKKISVNTYWIDR